MAETSKSSNKSSQSTSQNASSSQAAGASMASGDTGRSISSSDLSASTGASASGSNQQVDIAEVFRDSLNQVLTTVVSQLEPQMSQMANRIADQAVDRSRVLASQAARKVQSQPWYLVGVAAVVLVGAAIVLGLGERGIESSEGATLQ